jgi:hypothetical protein
MSGDAQDRPVRPGRPDSRMRARARASRAATRYLGLESRLIGMSKSGYRRARPSHAVVFNARLWLRNDAEPIWWGDLDLTVDEPRLRELVEKLDRSIWVTYEGSAGPNSPSCAAAFHANGRVELWPPFVRARVGLIQRQLTDGAS